MGARPGGKQPLMRDTVWNGKRQSLTRRVLVRGHYERIAKGLTEVLTEKVATNLK